MFYGLIVVSEAKVSWQSLVLSEMREKKRFSRRKSFEKKAREALCFLLRVFIQILAP